MRPRTVVYLIVFLILAVFVLANWGEISRPARLNLLVAEMTAPLGAMLLLVVGVILALDYAVHALSRHAWNRERRMLTQELERHRLRADQAEESRIRELRETVERESAMIRAQLERVLASLEGTRGGADVPEARLPGSPTADRYALTAEHAYEDADRRS